MRNMGRFHYHMIVVANMTMKSHCIILYTDTEVQFGEKPGREKMGRIYSWPTWNNVHYDCRKYKKVVSCYKYFQGHLKNPINISLIERLMQSNLCSHLQK
jgi:hypothetical protein